MNRLVLVALGLCVGLTPPAVSVVEAQDGCGGAAEGVDLAVRSARLRERDDGWVVLYTVANRGHMASTTYRVTLVVDGASVGEEDDYDVGLEPGRRRRWELRLPEEASPPNGHEVVVRVSTAGEDSAAGSGYMDQCGLNDVMPASHISPALQASRGNGVPNSAQRLRNHWGFGS